MLFSVFLMELPLGRFSQTPVCIRTRIEVTRQRTCSAVGQNPNYGMAGLAPFLMSLPERTLRSATALAAGLLREIGEVTIPRAPAARRTLYKPRRHTLRFLIEEVGGVEGVYPTEEKLAEDFLLSGRPRATASN